MMSRVIDHIKFRIHLGKKIGNIQNRVNLIHQDNLKQKFYANSTLPYLVISSIGGVGSSEFIRVIDRYAPYLVNPVLYCSHHRKLIDFKLKHLSKPLCSSTFEEFPAGFQSDLKKSGINPGNIIKGVFLFGDPSISTLSIYRRNLEHEHIFNRFQHSLNNAPSDIYAFILEQKDTYQIKKQITNWLQGVSQYDIMLVKYETMWEYLDEIATFCEVHPGDLKKEFVKKPRTTTKDENYYKLKEGVYKELHELIDSLPPIQIIKKTC